MLTNAASTLLLALLVQALLWTREHDSEDPAPIPEPMAIQLKLPPSHCRRLSHPLCTISSAAATTNTFPHIETSTSRTPSPQPSSSVPMSSWLLMDEYQPPEEIRSRRGNRITTYHGHTLDLEFKTVILLAFIALTLMIMLTAHDFFSPAIDLRKQVHMASELLLYGTDEVIGAEHVIALWMPMSSLERMRRMQLMNHRFRGMLRRYGFGGPSNLVKGKKKKCRFVNSKIEKIVPFTQSFSTNFSIRYYVPEEMKMRTHRDLRVLLHATVNKDEPVVESTFGTHLPEVYLHMEDHNRRLRLAIQKAEHLEMLRKADLLWGKLPEPEGEVSALKPKFEKGERIHKMVGLGLKASAGRCACPQCDADVYPIKRCSLSDGKSKRHCEAQGQSRQATGRVSLPQTSQPTCQNSIGGHAQHVTGRKALPQSSQPKSIIMQQQNNYAYMVMATKTNTRSQHAQIDMAGNDAFVDTGDVQVQEQRSLSRRDLQTVEKTYSITGAPSEYFEHTSDFRIINGVVVEPSPYVTYGEGTGSSSDTGYHQVLNVGAYGVDIVEHVIGATTETVKSSNPSRCEKHSGHICGEPDVDNTMSGSRELCDISNDISLDSILIHQPTAAITRPWVIAHNPMEVAKIGQTTTVSQSRGRDFIIVKDENGTGWTSGVTNRVHTFKENVEGDTSTMKTRAVEPVKNIGAMKPQAYRYEMKGTSFQHRRLWV